MLPLALEKTFGTLPDDFAKLDDLTIPVVGGGTGKTLRVRATHDMAKTLFENYSSNKSEPICIMASDGAGKVFPGVEVETVDDHYLLVWQWPGLMRIKSGKQRFVMEYF